MKTISIKLKKQYGWFLFLFIPFIILVSLHILMPLLIAINYHPILKDAYVDGNIKNQFNKVLTLSESNSQRVISQLQFFQDQLKDIETILCKQLRYLATRNNQKFVYDLKKYKNGGSIQDIQVFSGFYSTNSENISQLSNNSLPLYQNYKNKQILVAPFFINLIDSSITNMFMLSSKDNQTYSFMLSQSNSTQLLKQYSNIAKFLTFTNNQTVIKFTDNINTIFPHLSFCKPIQFDSSYQTVLCIRVDFIKVMKKIALYLQTAKVNYGKHTLNIYPINIPQYNQTSQQLELSNPYYSIQNIEERQLLVKYLQSNHSQFSLYQSSTKFYYFIFDSKNIINPQFVQVGKYQKLNNDNFINFQIDINSLVIPIVIIFTIFSLIVSCILIKLLNSMDVELFQLSKCCDYILAGDIDVEIPEFVGTKGVSEVYEYTRIISKLHKFSTDKYFTGHFSQKLLKYVQALQFFKKINYDTGYVLQNIGQACHWIEQWERAIDSLKESVSITLKKIEKQYGSINQMVIAKRTKQVPSGYKFLENILLRRLYKLNFSLLFAIQFQSFYVKFANQISNPQQIKKKTQIWIQQSQYYAQLQRKAFYPDHGSYSQSIIVHINEAKQLINLKKVTQGIKLLNKTQKLLKIYEKQFPEVSKKLKQKGSKMKLFHMRNRLSGQSRLVPQMLWNFFYIIKGKVYNQINSISRDPKIELQAFDYILQGFKCNVIVAVAYFLGVSEIRKTIKDLQLDERKFQSTQIFIQAMPFRTLHQGQVTKQMEAQLYKRHAKGALGLERQFILITDCNSSPLKEPESQQLSYSFQRLMYIYEKLIKPTDRLSLTKFTTKNGSKIQFNLTLKESSEIVLRKELQKVYNNLQTQRSYDRNLFGTVLRSIWRVRLLKSEKIIIVFLKSLKYYAHRQEQRKKKLLKRTKQRSTNSISENKEKILIQDQCQQFGQLLADQMRDPLLRNCKVIIYCSKEDSIDKVRDFFDLQNINKRIWAQQNQINVRNVVVYLIQHKHKMDIQKILMIKYMIVVDNNVFVL